MLPKTTCDSLNDTQLFKGHKIIQSVDSDITDIDLGSAEYKPLSDSQLENVLKKFQTRSDGPFDQEMLDIQIDESNKQVVSYKFQENFNIPYMSIPALAPVISPRSILIFSSAYHFMYTS